MRKSVLDRIKRAVAGKTEGKSFEEKEDIIIEAAKKQGLKGNKLTAYLAQVMEESNELSDFDENYYYSDLDRLRATFSEARNMTQEEYDEIYNTRGTTRAEREEKFFNRVYGGAKGKELGNPEGMGAKYRGRGPLQITGKYNYDKYAPGIDPEKLSSDLEAGAEASARYFADRTKDLDEDDFRGMTKRVNTALKGYRKRRSYYKKYKKKYESEKKEFMKNIRMPDKLDSWMKIEEDDDQNPLIEKLRDRIKNEA